MKKTATAPHEIFNEAMDWFFGHNPVNPYWFLLVLYLRKNHLLSIENNYPGDSVNALTPFNEPSYWRDVVGYEFPDGIMWQTVVGQLEGNERLLNIYSEFKNASKSRDEKRHTTPLSLENLYQWEDTFLLETVQMLLKIDDGWFDDNFNSCYDKAVRRIFATERSELYTQPLELTELVGFLMGDDVKRVYNPFTGVGSFTTITPRNATFFGEEINPLIAAIADLRLLSAGIGGEVSVANSINRGDHNADIIVSNPVFNLRIEETLISTIFGDANNPGAMLLQKCAQSNIRGIVVLPIGMSFRSGGDRRIREKLTSFDCVDMVIELPSNVLEGTGVATAIYVINPNHNHKGTIRIINASECFREGNRKRILDVEQIKGLVNGEDNDDVLTVETATIAECDFSFAYSRYAQLATELRDGTPLIPIGELGHVQNDRTSAGIVRGLFANFSKLSNPNKLKIYNADDFETQVLPRPTCQIDQDCIIVQSVRGLRAAAVHAEAEKPLHVPTTYYCYFPDTNIILPDFFVLQIQSDYIKKLFSDVSLRLADFLAIKLPVPSIEEQQRAVENYKSELVRELGIEVNELREKRFNEFEQNMHLRKHHLKHLLGEVVPAAQMLSRFISSQDGAFTKGVVIARRSQSTLEQYAAKLLHNTEKIQSLISALTDEETYGDPEVVDICDFVLDYKSHKFNEKYELAIIGESKIHEELDDDTDMLVAPDLTAYIAKSNLETIFDNIIANAVQHGFTDSDRRDYAIRVRFTNIVIDGREMLQLSIANNGEKLPMGMTTNRVFSWGVGSGTGLGSWQTKNIVEHFGGNIEFIQYDDEADGFNIEYRITLPMTK